jgi:uncharacterized membrane-anchored protein
MNPIRDLTRAVTMPLEALFVVGLCALINAMTSPGHWWFQWVALGMGIATIVALARGLRTAFALGLVAIVGWWLYRRYGADSRETFAPWASSAQPKAADVLRKVMAMSTSSMRS